MQISYETMKERALYELQQRAYLTKAQFFSATGSCNLNEYIRLLRKDGHNIVTEKEHKKCCKYVLVKDK